MRRPVTFERSYFLFFFSVFFSALGALLAGFDYVHLCIAFAAGTILRRSKAFLHDDDDGILFVIAVVIAGLGTVMPVSCFLCSLAGLIVGYVSEPLLLRSQQKREQGEVMSRATESCRESFTGTSSDVSAVHAELPLASSNQVAD